MSSQGRQPGPAEDTASRAHTAGLPCSEDDGRTIAWVLRQLPALHVEEEGAAYGQWREGVDPQSYREMEPIFRKGLAHVEVTGGTDLDFIGKMARVFGRPVVPYLMQFRDVLREEYARGTTEPVTEPLTEPATGAITESITGPGPGTRPGPVTGPGTGPGPVTGAIAEPDTAVCRPS